MRVSTSRRRIVKEPTKDRPESLLNKKKKGLASSFRFPGAGQGAGPSRKDGRAPRSAGKRFYDPDPSSVNRFRRGFGRRSRRGPQGGVHFLGGSKNLGHVGIEHDHDAFAAGREPIGTTLPVVERILGPRVAVHGFGSGCFLHKPFVPDGWPCERRGSEPSRAFFDEAHEKAATFSGKTHENFTRFERGRVVGVGENPTERIVEDGCGLFEIDSVFPRIARGLGPIP